MPHMSGKDLVIRFIYSGGTVVVSGDQREVSWDEQQNTADTTAGDDGYESHINTTRNVNGSISLLDNGVDGSAIYAAMTTGTRGTLEWGNEGTATGKPKYGLPVTITSGNSSMPYAGEIVRQYQWRGNDKTGWTANWERSGSTW